jgi:hypothetical protein
MDLNWDFPDLDKEVYRGAYRNNHLMKVTLNNLSTWILTGTFRDLDLKLSNIDVNHDLDQVVYRVPTRGEGGASR